LPAMSKGRAQEKQCPRSKSSLVRGENHGGGQRGGKLYALSSGDGPKMKRGVGKKGVKWEGDYYYLEGEEIRISVRSPQEGLPR